MLKALAAVGEAVVEAHRVEAGSPRAQLREEADRAGGAGAGERPDALADGLGERHRRVADRRHEPQSAAPSRLATRSAETTPSSWKPQPQYAPQKCVRLRPLISATRPWAATPAGV